VCLWVCLCSRSPHCIHQQLVEQWVANEVFGRPPPALTPSTFKPSARRFLHTPQPCFLLAGALPLFDMLMEVACLRLVGSCLAVSDQQHHYLYVLVFQQQNEYQVLMTTQCSSKEWFSSEL